MARCVNCTQPLDSLASRFERDGDGSGLLIDVDAEAEVRIAVCIKSVVDSQSRIELASDGRLVKEHVRWEVNDYDLYAVEEAIRLVETTEGQVLLISVGGEEVVQGLRKGLAMGAHSAIHIQLDKEDPDAAGVASILAAALRDRNLDLVLTGVESDDLGDSQVGSLLAESLGAACATVVIRTEVRVGSSTIRALRELEGGNHALIELPLPAVLTIQTGINEPRYPSLKGIMSAKRKELLTLTIKDLQLGGTIEPRVERLGLATPPPRQRARMLSGSVGEAAGELLRILREEEHLL